MRLKEVKAGDVIQATEKADKWAGALLIVDQVKEWGVTAGMIIPYKGIAYVRLQHDQFEIVGRAVLFLAHKQEE